MWESFKTYCTNPDNLGSIVFSVLTGLFFVLFTIVSYNKIHTKRLLFVLGTLVYGTITIWLIFFNLYIFTAVITLTISSLLYYVFYEKLRKKLTDKGKIKINYKDVKIKRFEEIQSLRYGYLEYSPFFYLGQKDKHWGIGMAVLEKIFSYNNNIQFIHYDGDINWDTALKKLEDDEFDIILTPLFETRSRLSDFNVQYCIPLFYSNIGLYVRKDFETAPLEGTLSFNKAIEFVFNKVKQSNWKAKYLKGELSQFLMEKHHLNENGTAIMKETISDADFKNIIKNIASGDPKKEQFTFMEVFKVESFIEQEEMVVNLLKPNELLYPVSFVVRKEHTVLKNLINLRIMQLRAEESTETGVNKLEKIIKDISLSADVSITPEKFKDIFIQKSDYPLPII